jgi:hypothetical protein
MSRGEGENPLDFSWTSESQEAGAEGHTPADRANHPARVPQWKTPLDKTGRPTGAYERAEMGARQAESQDKIGLGQAHRENNAALSAAGLAPETSPARWAKHSKKDKHGRPMAADETPSDNFIPREGRRERKPF